MISSTCSQPWNRNLYAPTSSWPSPENFNGQVTLKGVSPVFDQWGTEGLPLTDRKITQGTSPAFLPSSWNSNNQTNYSCIKIQAVASWFQETHRAEQPLMDWHFALCLFFLPLKMEWSLCAWFIKALLSKLIWNGMSRLPWRHAEAEASHCNSPELSQERPPLHFTKWNSHFIWGLQWGGWIIKGNS